MPMPEHIKIPAGRDPGDNHFYASLVKSIVRIGACVALFTGNIAVAAVMFGIAELIGIAEEII